MSLLSDRLKRTYSVCPVCLKRIPAMRTEENGGLVLQKACPEHGTFSSVIWRNKIDFESWRGDLPSVGEQENVNCPSGCGLCPNHLRATCCVLLEITDRCNLNCTFCFANPEGNKDPEISQVKEWIDDLTIPGKTLLQLSGGEPTVRDDLPEIVAYAKKAGCRYVQLNSNGLRLAEEEAFVKKLADAGLSFIFMQFDGVDDQVYDTLRCRPMLDIKKKAIEICGKHGIGVTLVPVITPGINDNQIGEIIRFAILRSPYVRGVHFQPVSYFGRIPKMPEDKDRFTLDELIDQVVKQSEGLIRMEHIAPSCCDHPMCGFHGDFAVLPDKTLYALTKGGETSTDCCCGSDPADKNREFVGRRWERRKEPEQAEKLESCCFCDADEDRRIMAEAAECCKVQENVDMTNMEDFITRVKSHGFTITSMAFQDAGTLDIERLRQCSLHVYKDGKHIPFCAYYLSPME